MVGPDEPRPVYSSPMLSERERLTVEAARRLLRTRLRQHLLRKAQEVDRRLDRGECWDLAIDSEKAIEAASEAAWLSTLRLWGQQPLVAGSPQRDVVNALIRTSLASAVERTQGFIHSRVVEYEYEDVKGWVLEYINGFDPNSLLDNGGKPCVSAT